MTDRRPIAIWTLFAISLVFAGATSEVLLRLYAQAVPRVGRAFVEWDPYAVLIEPHGTLGYRQKPGVVFRYDNGTVATTNHQGFRGPPAANPKPAGTFRIVLLGESTTHGWAVADDQTIDAHMRRLFAQRFPERAVEVVNLAFDGYDSHQIYQRLGSDGLALDPDLVVINAGINDVRNARYQHLEDPDPRTVLWLSELTRLRAERERGGPTWWTRVKHTFFLARLPGMVRDRVNRPSHVARGITAMPNPQAADLFERNMLRSAQLLTSGPVPLLLSTPPSALLIKYDSATRTATSYWIVDAATTQRYRDSLAKRLEGVAARLSVEGRPVAYVRHGLFADSLFLDDCHLTPAGNLRMAEDLVNAIAPYLAPAASPPGIPSATRRPAD